MRLHFDVRIKVFLILIAGICTFIVNALPFEAGFIALLSILQLLSGKKVFRVSFVASYFCLVMMQLFLLPILPNAVAMMLSVPVVSFRKMFPCIMAVLLLIKTTKVNEAIATMTRLRLPKSVTITFAVTLRYIPSLREELHHIREAMMIRQLDLRRLGLVQGIVKKTECYLVPVLISATKTAETLSAAAITRGIENPSLGTCRGYRRMAGQDYVLFVVCAALVVLSIILKIGG